MQTVTVEIPVRLYEDVQREARFGEGFSDTVRRFLDERGITSGSQRTRAPSRGYLLDLIRAGLLAEGDRLVIDLPRRGDHHTGVVTALGEIELPDGRRFGSPSGAAKACLGSSNNGWAKWSRADDGRTLDDLRTEMRKVK